MFTVELKADQFTGALEGLAGRMEDLTPLMEQIGEYLTRSTKQRFAEGKGPDGTDWATNSPVTLARKAGAKPLIDTRTLSQGIHHEAGADFVEVGSNTVQAAMMQFGGTKAQFPHLWGDIPARPFLGISDADETALVALVEDYLTETLGTT